MKLQITIKAEDRREIFNVNGRLFGDMIITVIRVDGFENVPSSNKAQLFIAAQQI